ncbi:hypothetical protein Btru_063278 [Bulinus truncatus]|nr:hypothetical protein Btru_063278 [Bulinus truncatus]
MTTTFDPLLPAFHILWNTAVSAHRPNSPAGGPVKGGAHHQQQQLNNLRAYPAERSDHDVNENEQSPAPNRSFHPQTDSGAPQGRFSKCEETVVVCTLDCDSGDKFTRQIIYENPNRTEWARAEDHFVDWLNSELTLHQAQRIEVTVYLCHLPMDTTSHGIGLWLKNLQTEGKEIKVTLKVASLSNSVPSANDLQNPGLRGYRCQSNDVIKALRNLTASSSIQIEGITSRDWAQLIQLLTDRNAIQALDKSQQHATEVLHSLLQTDQQC